MHKVTTFQLSPFCQYPIITSGIFIPPGEGLVRIETYIIRYNYIKLVRLPYIYIMHAWFVRFATAILLSYSCEMRHVLMHTGTICCLLHRQHAHAHPLECVTTSRANPRWSIVCRTADREAIEHNSQSNQHTTKVWCRLDIHDHGCMYSIQTTHTHTYTRMYILRGGTYLVTVH